MDEFRTAWKLVYPDPSIWLMGFGFVSVVIVLSTFFNNQTTEGKILNMAKGFFFILGGTGWAAMVRVYTAAPTVIPWQAILILGSTYVFSITGDWIAYLISHAVKHPGGSRGYVWDGIARLATRAAMFATERGKKSIPAPYEKLADRIASLQKKVDAQEEKGTS